MLLFCRTMALPVVMLVGLAFANPTLAEGHQPKVTPGDSGREVNTIVIDSYRPRDHERPNTGSSTTNPKAEGPVVVNDSHCVATVLTEPWCLQNVAPTGPTRGGVTSFDLAVRATNQLPLPIPKPRIIPSVQFSSGMVGGFAGMPLWLWFPRSEWRSITQRTSAGGAWAMVTARPTRQIWELGDGTTVACNGPGRVYEVGMDPLNGSPDCGSRYSRTSKNKPGGVYSITVTVMWDVTWKGSGGAAGQLGPLPISASMPYTVREARAQLVSP
jgi:hypothetical protein